jgi:multidrug efflux pump subunit AcrB
LQARGLTLGDVRGTIALATSNAAKGGIQNENQSFTIAANDQLQRAADYDNAILAYRNGAPIRVHDIGRAVEGPQDINVGALSKEQPCILLIVFKQPGANIIETVDLVQASLPQIYSALPHAVRLETILDRIETIRASVRDVEFTLLLTIALVVLVVFLFLRQVRATLIPSATVPLSVLGAFAWMYLMGYSLDNLSLMGLSIAIGFVVDDAIVVIENIYRNLEKGASPMEAALNGSSEIGFTVVSISVSLVAVFIPLLLMGGIIGRLFREFSVTVTAAILVSMVVCLTLTPMLSSRFLRPESGRHSAFYERSERGFEALVDAYGRALNVVLRHQFATLLVFLATLALTVLLFVLIPKGLLPTQDTGLLTGLSEAAQDVSPEKMKRLHLELTRVIERDPDVATVGSVFGSSTGSTSNTGRFFVGLKPHDQRNASATQIVDRLRPQLAKVEGVMLYLQPAQDITVGGRIGRGLYQYTLKDANVEELNIWAQRLLGRLRTLPELADVSSDQQNSAPQVMVTINREAAARFGIQPELVSPR